VIGRGGEGKIEIGKGKWGEERDGRRID